MPGSHEVIRFAESDSSDEAVLHKRFDHPGSSVDRYLPGRLLRAETLPRIRRTTISMYIPRQIRTPWFSSVGAAVDIHRLTADCRTEYEGTVQLNRPTIDVGIPPNKWSRLVFVFASLLVLGQSEWLYHL